MEAVCANSADEKMNTQRPGSLRVCMRGLYQRGCRISDVGFREPCVSRQRLLRSRRHPKSDIRNPTSYPCRLTSDTSLLASGLVWPAYLLFGLSRYETDTGVDTCSKVNEQIRIPGYSATAMRLRLLSSSVALPI